MFFNPREKYALPCRDRLLHLWQTGSGKMSTGISLPAINALLPDAEPLGLASKNILGSTEA